MDITCNLIPRLDFSIKIAEIQTSIRIEMRKLIYFLISISMLTSVSGLHAQQSKYALVIGVKAYQYVQPLQNSLNDARDMAALLKRKGFTVIELYDPATKRSMQDAVLKYFELIRSQPKAAGLVYYSGHGMQVKGSNYLMPTFSNPQVEADLDDQCMNMDYVMRAIEQAGNELNIFVLDACRNNPFHGFSRSSEKGLSMVETPKGSYIVYSTKPGSVASDGIGGNGLFTSKLLQYIDTPGLNIEQVFKKAAHDVAQASGDAQRPWIASDFTGDFFFTPGGGQRLPNASQPSEPLIISNELINKISESTVLDYGYGEKDAPVIAIGKQEWMAKNLNVVRFNNGDSIPQAKAEGEWKLANKEKRPAWCYYENDPSKGNTHGKLYNWYAVIDPRGLAPRGWHIPGDAEWTALSHYLGGDESAGGKMKSIDLWNGNGNGSNLSRFNSVPSGFRDIFGAFHELGNVSNFWSASEFTSDIAWSRYLYSTNAAIVRKGSNKGSGFSIRCIREARD
jgi:uncharacterized protein (TIGR02145 family)